MSGNMSGNALMVGIVIIAGGILLFFLPLMAVSKTQNEITQVAVQALVSEFATKEASIGKIVQDDLNEFQIKLDATASVHTYSVEIEHKILTTNPNKGEDNKLGESLFYSIFALDIMNDINTTGEHLMKEGDYLIITVKNDSPTMFAQLMNSVYRLVGKDISTIAATAVVLVPNTGNSSLTN